MTRRLALLAVLLLGAAGCGGSDAPDGYSTYEFAEASVAHPDGWEVTVTNPGPVTKLAVAQPEGAQEGDVVPQVELRVTTLEPGDDFDELVDGARKGRDELLADRNPVAKELDLKVDRRQGRPLGRGHLHGRERQAVPGPERQRPLRGRQAPRVGDRGGPGGRPDRHRRRRGVARARVARGAAARRARLPSSPGEREKRRSRSRSNSHSHISTVRVG